MRRAEKQFAVIGLGRFGLAVCQELTDSGAQVLAIDVNEETRQVSCKFCHSSSSGQLYT